MLINMNEQNYISARKQKIIIEISDSIQGDLVSKKF